MVNNKASKWSSHELLPDKVIVQHVYFNSRRVLPYMYIHGLYRYVRLPKVCFFSHFGHKEGIYFGYFDPKYGVYSLHSCLGFGMSS